MVENAKYQKATKSRILFLLRYLYDNTDDEHAISTNELIDVLAQNGFSANRKTVRNDVYIPDDEINLHGRFDHLSRQNRSLFTEQ